MNHLKRFWLLAILAAALMVIGCSDDDPADPGGGGNNDNTPPGIASVTPLDQFHIDVEFDEAVQPASAQQPNNYTILETAKASSPGDPIGVGSAALDRDGKTVHLATEDAMGDNPYNLSVSGVVDLNGNVIETAAESGFAGSDDPDLTPPTVINHLPGAGETGVGIGQAVEVQFSEPMDYSSLMSAFSLRQGGNPVAFDVDDEEGNTYIFAPLNPLENNTTYTVTIDGTAEDWAGNSLTTVTWMFTTTQVNDTTLPYLVSSTPANGAVNVPVTTSIVLTFSEPVDPNSLDDIVVTPEIPDGIDVWSDGGRTITFTPYEDLVAATTYNLLIPPGTVRDLAGNGNEDLIQIVWSTGSSLASGSFSGTLTGPGSAAATGPGGAIVIAADRDPFSEEDDDLGIAGTGTANAQGEYSVENLPDGTHWPAAFLNTNDDGEIDPSYGDAIGAYGVTFDPMSGEPMPLIIAEGQDITEIDFEIYDPMAFVGTFSYVGSMHPSSYTFYVGLFDTEGFDIENPGDPVIGTEGDYWPGDGEWTLSELDDGLEAGTYFVGAYLDVDFNQVLDPGEPAGFIGGLEPTPFTVGNGSDQLGLIISLDDTETGFTAWSNWPGDRTIGDGKDKLRRLVRAFKETMNK